ncbi:MAG: ankyrin repeat domain-containing protein [Spirochaetes bacterium]|nr:ankyrin repeat domain-containing protein [Spirochaetota bacterium]
MQGTIKEAVTAILLAGVLCAAGCAGTQGKDKSAALTKELWNAVCSQGNDKVIAELIRKGANVRYAENGLPLINKAVSCKVKVDRIKTLLDAGADINSVNHAQESVLMFAVDYDQPELVKYLLERGANIHQRNEFGANALSWAQDRINKRELNMYLRNAGLASMGYGFVKAKSGLWLRAQPSRKSDNFILVPHNERVDYIMMMPGSRETIDGINNYWYKVRYKGSDGYVFGGYLGRDPN